MPPYRRPAIWALNGEELGLLTDTLWIILHTMSCHARLPPRWAGIWADRAISSMRHSSDVTARGWKNRIDCHLTVDHRTAACKRRPIWVFPSVFAAMSCALRIAACAFPRAQKTHAP